MRHLRVVMGTFVCLSALGSAGMLFAKDSEEAKKSDLPSCLTKLKLTDEQKSKAKEIVQKYDEKIDKAMKHFSRKYLETVETEAALLTSVEDILSEHQRESIRKERRKTAHSDDDADKGDANKSDATGTARSDTKPQAESSQDKVTSSNKSPIVAEKVDEITLGNGVTLTVDQEVIADRITNKHMAHLRALHRRVHMIHNRLIALETDKIVELEKLLTKEQLDQLHQDRQAAADDSHAASTSSK